MCKCSGLYNLPHFLYRRLTSENHLRRARKLSVSVAYLPSLSGRSTDAVLDTSNLQGTRTSGPLSCSQEYGAYRSSGCMPPFTYSFGQSSLLNQLGSYHYVSGVDASTSASLAAYINSLTYSIEDDAGWFSKGSGWKVRNGCYWYVHLLCAMKLYQEHDVTVVSMRSQELT